MEKGKDKGKAPEEDDWNPMHGIAVASGAGVTILISIALGVWMGLKCDEFFDSSPFGTIFLSVMGALSGLYSVIKQIVGKK